MLYCDEHIPPEELQYMRDHPEELEWLKSNVRPKILEEICGLRQ